MRNTASHHRGRLLWTASAVLATSLCASHAWAWGHTGHVEISELAIVKLPASIPQFVRNLNAAKEIGQLGPEPDLSKGAGTIHDEERDPGHYIDIDDSGNVEGVSPFVPLAETREALDTAQRVGGQTQYSSGYLPYNDEIVDAWTSSATITVGYPQINVSDIESGKVHLTRTSFASD